MIYTIEVPETYTDKIGKRDRASIESFFDWLENTIEGEEFLDDISLGEISFADLGRATRPHGLQPVRVWGEILRQYWYYKP